MLTSYLSAGSTNDILTLVTLLGQPDMDMGWAG